MTVFAGLSFYERLFVCLRNKLVCIKDSHNIYVPFADTDGRKEWALDSQTGAATALFGLKANAQQVSHAGRLDCEGHQPEVSSN